jgi:hypothetical protein
MENYRRVHLERWFGNLFMASGAVWHLLHRHQPANRITDCFAGLGTVGAVILLHVALKL